MTILIKQVTRTSKMKQEQVKVAQTLAKAERDNSMSLKPYKVGRGEDEKG
jgi:hypothetical protein